MRRSIVTALLSLPLAACATEQGSVTGSSGGGGKADGDGSSGVGVVAKQTAVIASFAFADGHPLPEIKLGYETYGTLNAAKDNVIVLAPFLAGHSHAAGVFSASDAVPGWWDALVGPGRAIDTTKWFVVSTDVLTLPRSKPSIVVTTGPASQDAAGNTYGPDFPAVSFVDQVHAQRAILDQLGVTRVRAVLGASMGGMIAWQWAVTYPDFVDEVVPVAAPIGYSDAEIAGLEYAKQLIETDPDWAGGRYYGTGREPDVGLGEVLAILNGIIVPSPKAALANIDWSQLPTTFPDPAKLPNLQTYIDEAKQGFDGNNFVYTLDAFERYDIASQLAPSGVRFTVLGFEDDQLVAPDHVQAADDDLSAVGLSHSVQVLPGGHGHLSCLFDLGELAPVIAGEL
jgi:homoserine O-acetyltransferase